MATSTSSATGVRIATPGNAYFDDLLNFAKSKRKIALPKSMVENMIGDAAAKSNTAGSSYGSMTITLPAGEPATATHTGTAIPSEIHYPFAGRRAHGPLADMYPGPLGFDDLARLQRMLTGKTFKGALPDSEIEGFDVVCTQPISMDYGRSIAEAFNSKGTNGAGYVLLHLNSMGYLDVILVNKMHGFIVNVHTSLDARTSAVSEKIQRGELIAECGKMESLKAILTANDGIGALLAIEMGMPFRGVVKPPGEVLKSYAAIKSASSGKTVDRIYSIIDEIMSYVSDLAYVNAAVDRENHDKTFPVDAFVGALNLEKEIERPTARIDGGSFESVFPAPALDVRLYALFGTGVHMPFVSGQIDNTFVVRGVSGEKLNEKYGFENDVVTAFFDDTAQKEQFVKSPVLFCINRTNSFMTVFVDVTKKFSDAAASIEDVSDILPLVYTSTDTTATSTSTTITSTTTSDMGSSSSTVGKATESETPATSAGAATIGSGESNEIGTTGYADENQNVFDPNDD